jgi:hypothetical protein
LAVVLVDREANGPWQHAAAFGKCGPQSFRQIFGQQFRRCVGNRQQTAVAAGKNPTSIVKSYENFTVISLLLPRQLRQDHPR